MVEMMIRDSVGSSQTAFQMSAVAMTTASHVAEMSSGQIVPSYVSGGFVIRVLSSKVQMQMLSQRCQRRGIHCHSKKKERMNSSLKSSIE